MSTSDLLHRAEELYFRVSELPAARREAAVEQACRGDPALAAEVRSLMAHADRVERFLEEPALGTDFALPAPAAAGAAPGGDDLVGRQMGRYRIERRIASGGMGTVYLATRADDEFVQRFALKVVKRGMDSEEILRRFRAERQTLASLDHPNIARLLDGGATDTGQPFLVMEYVEGEPIDRYCDRHRLGSAERLRLFLVVCDAVRHAHRNLVVHRDLKPANVLVTAEGVPKLLDFGIAKVLADEGPRLATAAHERRLTPEYASPEQITNGRVTTSSDVYSLGVILYELLTGHQPRRFPTRTPAEIERVAVEGTTTPPSEAVTRVEAREAPGGGSETITPEAVGQARGATPEQLRRRLRGDLDTIVLAALRQEPERRYASVEQLANDVRCHLEGLPVSARKDTFGYHAAKFVRRHAAGTTVSVLAVLLLAVGAVAFARQARLAASQRDEAFLARDQSEATTDFLRKMLASVDPGVGGREVTVHEVLDAVAPRLEDELPSQPLVQASLRSTIGRTYLSLGLLDQAEEQMRRAYDERRARLGPRHHDVAESMGDLAELLYARRSLDEAEALLREALDVFREVRGERNPDVARTLSSLGAVLRAQGELDEAEQVHRLSLEIRRGLPEGYALDVAESLNNLAGVLLGRNRLEEAAELLAEAHSIRLTGLGPRHPLVAQSLDNQAVVLARMGQLERAEPLYREALALEEELLGASHPDVAVTQKNLAALYLAQRRYAPAEELLRASLATREGLYPPTDSRVFNTRIDLADALANLGRWDEATPLLEQALESARDPSVAVEVRVRALDRAADVFQVHGDEQRTSELRAESAAETDG